MPLLSGPRKLAGTFCDMFSLRRISIIYFAFANATLHSLQTSSKVNLNRSIIWGGKRTLSASHHRMATHLVDSFLCSEVKVDFQCGNITSITILEANAEAQEALIMKALDEKSIAAEEDPYGSVLWPSAKTVSMRLLQIDINGKSVLELGTGTGLVSLVASLSGAKSVLATDYSMFCLSLLEKAQTLQNVPIPPGVLKTQFFDVKDFSKSLPPADIVVIADLLYDKGLAVAVGKRVCEAYARGSLVIVGNSPGRCGTTDMLRTCEEILGFPCVFKEAIGQTVTGHRHSLIGNTSTDTPRPLSTTILELQLKH